MAKSKNKEPETEDLARRPPKNALKSYFDAWAKAKLDDPEQWQQEWNEATRWCKEEYLK